MELFNTSNTGGGRLDAKPNWGNWTYNMGTHEKKNGPEVANMI